MLLLGRKTVPASMPVMNEAAQAAERVRIFFHDEITQVTLRLKIAKQIERHDLTSRR